MKLALIALLFVGCGYSSVANDVIGQPKKLHNNTPILCPDYQSVDVSLGVMRNGVGSMSTDDQVFLVKDDAQAQLINDAISAGKLVKIRFNERRITFCVPDYQITSVNVVD